jgi:hypothetical protein
VSTPDADHIRETAVAMYAADMMWFGECPTAEAQVAWCRSALSAGERGIHDGDCIGQPQACLLCVWEKWRNKAAAFLSPDE